MISYHISIYDSFNNHNAIGIFDTLMYWYCIYTNLNENQSITMSSDSN